jgi:hypothetical protein
MPRPLASVLLALPLALVACGPADTAAPPPEETPIPVEPDNGIGDGATPPAAEETLTGTLGGDTDLEGGCAWLDAEDGTRYEVFYPDGYEVRFEPLELVGPDGEVVATEGDTVTVTGGVAEDMMSFCQVGTIFTATGVEG